jgi:hypothetical protein
MRKLLLAALVATLVCSLVHARPPFSSPNLAEFQFVTQLPAELPQRLTGFAFDGEKLWATVYLGRGRYATLDPATTAERTRVGRPGTVDRGVQRQNLALAVPR